MDISVICPVFETRPELLAGATRSVMDACAAGGLTGQLILADDGSTNPETRAELERLEGQGALVVRQSGNAGPASARNLGLGAASGRWIGFIDADDLWLPGRFGKALPLMARPEVGWIGGRHRFLGGVTPSGVASALGIAADGVAQGPDLTRCLLANFWMHLGAMLVRRDLLNQIGGFGPGLYYYEDFLLMARLSVLSPLHLIDADVYDWRRENEGLTASPRRLSRDTLRMHAQAARVPSLAPFRRELRWARYSALKGLAVNNLLAGRRAAALRLALEAWAMDPREIGNLVRFLGLSLGGAHAARASAGRYSQVEIFVQDPAA